jgi:hypothetical protein
MTRARTITGWEIAETMFDSVSNECGATSAHRGGLPVGAVADLDGTNVIRPTHRRNGPECQRIGPSQTGEHNVGMHGVPHGTGTHNPSDGHCRTVRPPPKRTVIENRLINRVVLTALGDCPETDGEHDPCPPV